MKAMLTLLASLSLLPLALLAEKRPMSIVDLLEVPRLGDARLSPDGSEVLFVLAEADWEKNRRISHVWRLELGQGEPRQLTNGEEGEQSPRWSPDGTHVAFLAKRGDDEVRQIYVLRTGGGEAWRLSEHETAVSSLSWSPDGSRLFFLADDPKSEEEKEREKAKDDVFAFDEDFEQSHLWRISFPEGEETRVSEGDDSVRGYRLSRDGSRIVAHRAPTPLVDDRDESEVWILAADGGDGRRLTDNGISERGGELSPDGSTVLFVSDSNERFETYHNDNLFLVPAAGGAHRLLLPDMPHEVIGATWSQDGSSIYFTANTGVRSQLFVVEVASERLTQLTEGDHTLGAWSYRPEIDRHLFALSTPENAGDLWTLTAGAKRQRVSRVFDYLAEEKLLPRQEAITWEGEDGLEVEGLLCYPLDYRAGERYPLVVQTHGGPASSDKFSFGRWSRYVPVLAARGWAVFKPNYRGSTGYGDPFLRDMVGHYYRQSHLDVMTGVDHLIARGIADPERMVKMGWSGGGHMTNKIITHTDRFKAAASGAGAVNWISMYGQSDVRIFRTPWFGGTPWQKDAPIDVYWEHSPLKDIWKVKTPTLVLVGENDVRVPPPQSVELYRALKSNGVPTHLYMAPREPHGWRELRHELFKVNVELDWFERHALGRDYTWEKAPGEEEEEQADRASRKASSWDAESGRVQDWEKPHPASDGCKREDGVENHQPSERERPPRSRARAAFGELGLASKPAASPRWADVPREEPLVKKDGGWRRHPLWTHPPPVFPPDQDINSPILSESSGRVSWAVLPEPPPWRQAHGEIAACVDDSEDVDSLGADLVQDAVAADDELTRSACVVFGDAAAHAGEGLEGVGSLDELLDELAGTGG